MGNNFVTIGQPRAEKSFAWHIIYTNKEIGIGIVLLSLLQLHDIVANDFVKYKRIDRMDKILGKFVWNTETCEFAEVGKKRQMALMDR